MLAVAHILQAQTVREEIQQDRHCSAGNYMAYPQPSQQPLTPAPDGKRPFYIGHYGGHGSRYHNGPEMYDAPWAVMARADSLGKLTPLGSDVLRRLQLIREDADERWGELTARGAQQQREVMQRLVERFPEVFDGDTYVSARSTSTTRCILSMENALLQISLLKPLLMHQNATQRDMHYLNMQVKRLFSMRLDKKSTACYESFAKKHSCDERLLQSLFNDTAYVSAAVDVPQFCRDLFRVASNVQSSELRDQLTLYDIYTPDELYANWKRENAWLYVNHGAFTMNGGQKPYMQRNLLRNMIEKCDSALTQKDPMVHLRFGDSEGVLPLAALLDVNGYGVATDNLEALDSLGWVDYRIAPMGANIQLVLYRKDMTDADVLVKVLLNENESRLPIPTDVAPYYHWKDVRAYYLKKLEAYESK